MAGCSGWGRQEQGNPDTGTYPIFLQKIVWESVGWEGGGVGGVCALVTVKHLSPWVFQLQLTNHITVIRLEGKRKSSYKRSPLHIWVWKWKSGGGRDISLTNTFASFFVFVIFCAIKCSIKQRKAHVGLWNEKEGGFCIRGAIAPKVEKTRNTVR